MSLNLKRGQTSNHFFLKGIKGSLKKDDILSENTSTVGLWLRYMYYVFSSFGSAMPRLSHGLGCAQTNGRSLRTISQIVDCRLSAALPSCCFQGWVLKSVPYILKTPRTGSRVKQRPHRTSKRGSWMVLKQYLGNNQAKYVIFRTNL